MRHAALRPAGCRAGRYQVTAGGEAAPSPVDVRFVLFGGVRIVRGGVEVEVTQPRQRALLALLLANAGAVVTVDAIVDALWAGRTAATAVNQVHRHVGALRRTCEPGLGRRQAGRFISAAGRGYGITLHPGTCDVAQFRLLAAQARELHDSGGHADALQVSFGALAVAASPAGDEGMPDLPEFVSLEDERVAALVLAAELCHSAVDFAAVIPHLRSAVECHPFDESLSARLVTALSGTGRGAEAVSVYRTMRRRLRADLGCEPGPELTRALADALRDTPSRSVAGTGHAETGLPRPAQLPMPLPGVEGRSHTLTMLVERSARRRVLTLTGPTGVGKTALAVRHATQIAAQYPDGQLYVDLGAHGPSGTPTTPLDALGDMLVGLHVAVHALPPSVGARSGLLRSVLSTRRVLILLDDAQDFAQIEALLPGPGRSDVIVTSRRAIPALAAFGDADSIELTPLPARRPMNHRGFATAHPEDRCTSNTG